MKTIKVIIGIILFVIAIYFFGIIYEFVANIVSTIIGVFILAVAIIGGVIFVLSCIVSLFSDDNNSKNISAKNIVENSDNGKTIEEVNVEVDEKLALLRTLQEAVKANASLTAEQAAASI